MKHIQQAGFAIRDNKNFHKMIFRYSKFHK